MTKVLTVEDLTISFGTGGSELTVVHKVNFTLEAGKTLALVGESGSGKSVTSLGIMRLLSPSQSNVRGKIVLHSDENIDLLSLSESRMRRLRGDRIAMIFQEPLTSLNPVYTIGDQIIEAIRSHRRMSKKAARDRAIELIDQVGIPDAEHRLGTYPHELSGGMRQRIMIAIALALEPDILIADEPTTALDVTVQAQILELLNRLQEETGMAMLFITHDFGVVAEIADRTIVMYAGEMVEEGSTETVLERPLMPYTSGLMRAVPKLETAGLKDGDLESIEGFVPHPDNRPAGCSFHPRCTHALAGTCDVPPVPIEDAGDGHLVRCKRWKTLQEAAE
ncbi:MULTISPECIES: ABC transporter ATP-binding protein [Salipiger]|uniref:Oligopeptide transport system ATP-binding protein n=1 Tax=Salipiger profundus TaxID=1229727 RepID=A0A1U7DDR0_9RHOB|nr:MULTISPECIES: ABC transporter ATP-binding protein [Salipiger]APX26263.1 oligopeptide transport system ATP-binding protein [Salipiger profundus]GGA27524.1 ABC transporter ATP-binding protein [Salipiger profundus]SFD74691.1 oligopeptide transport system ATP-binding protein [Salipiger profundus]